MNIYIQNKQKTVDQLSVLTGLKKQQQQKGIKSLSLTTKLTSKLKKQHTWIRTGISIVKYILYGALN